MSLNLIHLPLSSVAYLWAPHHQMSALKNIVSITAYIQFAFSSCWVRKELNAPQTYDHTVLYILSIQYIYSYFSE